MAAPEFLVWVDCEMTGLDLERDELVEVAVVITDYELRQIGPGFDIVIKPSDASLEGMNDFVRTMHTTSGLLEDIPSGVPLADAEEQVLAFIAAQGVTAGTAPLAGNTIGTDRSFIAKYMPKLDAYLHYRSVDVSSIKELSKRWYPRVFFNAPEKHGGHRALADILESVRELAYYRATAFVPQPGPSTEEARAAAEAVVAGHADRA